MIFFYQNAHSIRNKVDEIRLATSSCPFQVIALTESWLDNSFGINEHFSKKFNVYRCDRSRNTSDRNGGDGVLVAVDAQLNREHLILSNSEGLEYVCAKINFESINVFVFVVYISSFQETEKFLLFSEIVKLIPFNTDDIVLVCGDFNQPGIKWVKADDDEYYSPTNVSTSNEIVVCDSMLDMGFNQMCNLENVTGNVLDLEFTNRVDELSLNESQSPLLPLDNHHRAFEVEISIESKKNQHFNRAN